jgi:hypothetical protein
MTDEQRDKLRRAIALPGWRWVSGMATDDGDRVAAAHTLQGYWAGEFYTPDGSFVVADFDRRDFPDPDDHATAGCLLALLGAIEAGADPGGSGRWSVSPDGERYCSGPSLGWACVEVALALGRWPGGEG